MLAASATSLVRARQEARPVGDSGSRQGLAAGRCLPPSSAPLAMRARRGRSHRIRGRGCRGLLVLAFDGRAAWHSRI